MNSTAISKSIICAIIAILVTVIVAIPMLEDSTTKSGSQSNPYLTGYTYVGGKVAEEHTFTFSDTTPGNVIVDGKSISYNMSGTIDYILTDTFMIRGTASGQYLLISSYLSSSDPNAPTVLPMSVKITPSEATITMSDSTIYSLDYSWVVYIDKGGEYCYTRGGNTHYANAEDVILLGGNTSTRVFIGIGTIAEGMTIYNVAGNQEVYSYEFKSLQKVEGTKDLYTFQGIDFVYTEGGATSTYDRIFVKTTTQGNLEGSEYELIRIVPPIICAGLIFSIIGVMIRSRFD